MSEMAEIQIPCEAVEFGTDCMICGKTFGVSLYDKRTICPDCRSTLYELVKEKRAQKEDETV